MRNMSVYRVAVVLIILALATALSAMPQQYPDPVFPGDPGSYCSAYCGAQNCGCGAPPDGYYLASYSCTCSSNTCTRTCTYNPY